MFLQFGVMIGILLLVIGVPIFAVFAVSGGIILGFHLNIPWYAMGLEIFESVTKYMLVAIPLFIFAGHLMLSGGIARRLTDMFVAYLGHYKAGLAMAACLSVALFSAISGSILASIITIGAIMIPEMEKNGYPRAFATALIASVAGIDALIPPSNAAIIYCSITGSSVSDVFMAGMLPGILQMVLLMVAAMLLCRKLNVQSMPRSSWHQRLVATYKALPAMSLPVIILGGIYSGFFLPTDAAAIAVVCCILIGFFIYRELTFTRVWQAMIATAKSTAVIFILVASASFISQVLIFTQIPQKITAYTIGFGIGPLSFMMLAMLASLILGTFMEAVPKMLITVPIFMVIATKLGINLVHFFVPLQIFMGIGLLTPPIAVGAYTAASVGNVSATKVFRQIYPWMFLVLILSGVINIFVPWLSLWLPATMHH
jgi:C4-dicarboxylate transporter DctM subunit